MPRTVGPDWGMQVAQILTGAGERKHQKEMQEVAQQHQAAQQAMGQAFDLVVGLAKTGKMPPQAATEVIATLMGPGLSAGGAGGIDPESVEALITAAATPQAQAMAPRAEETAELGLEAQRLGVESAGEQVGIQKAERRMAEAKADVYPDLLDIEKRTGEGRIDLVLAQTEVASAQKEAIMADTSLTPEKKNQLISQVNLNNARADHLRKQLSFIEWEMSQGGTVDLSELHKRANVLLDAAKATEDPEAIQKAVAAVTQMYEDAGAPFPYSAELVEKYPGLFNNMIYAVTKGAFGQFPGEADYGLRFGLELSGPALPEEKAKLRMRQSAPGAEPESQTAVADIPTAEEFFEARIKMLKKNNPQWDENTIRAAARDEFRRMGMAITEEELKIMVEEEFGDGGAISADAMLNPGREEID